MQNISRRNLLKGSAVAAAGAATISFSELFRFNQVFAQSGGDDPQTILEQLSEELSTSAPPQEAAPQATNQSLPEPLSERELEVLQLIDSGASNQEIANHLVIGMSTVKKHINHVFGKLGVDSRTQAIVRARALNLL